MSSYIRPLDTTVQAINLPTQIDQQSLVQLFSIFGTILNLELKTGLDGSHNCMVTFDTCTAANTALHLSGTLMGDKILVIGLLGHLKSTPLASPPWIPMPIVEGTLDNCVKISHLPAHTTSHDIQQFFRLLNPVSIDRTHDRAIVTFATPEQAEAALHMQSHPFGGWHPIRMDRVSKVKEIVVPQRQAVVAAPVHYNQHRRTEWPIRHQDEREYRPRRIDDSYSRRPEDDDRRSRRSMSRNRDRDRDRERDRGRDRERDRRVTSRRRTRSR
ncbi:hypothetical protein CLU79DRAFT_778962 [Phycomyces nitens]|nr:hypothetical protein CLU79DRAFT_778962 [Phycomyces nitens]